MTDILVMGADGQQGVIASRLLEQMGRKIACTDIYMENIAREVNEVKTTVAYCDHRDPDSIRKTLKRFDPCVVLNCADDRFNDDVLSACIEAQVHYVDLGSGVPDTARRLARHDEAKQAGITAIMGAGSVPGIGSVMMRSISRDFTEIETAEGGFAYDSNRPDFVPPFFLYITLWELSLPVKVLRHGDIVEIPARSLSCNRMFELIGDQTLFAVSHSEIFSYHHYFGGMGLKDMVFYAGFPTHHRQVLDSLITIGLNRDRSYRVNMGDKVVDVHPCDFLNAVAKTIFYPEGYTEAETLWAKATGTIDNKRQTVEMQCIVPPIVGWERYGSNVDTGFPAAVMADMILHESVYERGVFCPEGIIPPEPFFAAMQMLGFRFKVIRTPA